jgi:putative transposase
MIQDYRKVVGQRTGGIKCYAALKQGFINQDIKIDRDKLYEVFKQKKVNLYQYNTYLRPPPAFAKNVSNYKNKKSTYFSS